MSKKPKLPMNRTERTTFIALLAAVLIMAGTATAITATSGSDLPFAILLSTFLVTAITFQVTRVYWPWDRASSGSEITNRAKCHLLSLFALACALTAGTVMVVYLFGFWIYTILIVAPIAAAGLTYKAADRLLARTT